MQIRRSGFHFCTETPSTLYKERPSKIEGTESVETQLLRI